MSSTFFKLKKLKGGKKNALLVSTFSLNGEVAFVETGNGNSYSIIEFQTIFFLLFLFCSILSTLVADRL